MVPKCNDKCAYMREAEEDLTYKERKGPVTTEGEIGAVQPQTKEYQQPPEAG